MTVKKEYVVSDMVQKFCTNYLIKDERYKKINGKSKIAIPFLHECFSCWWDINAPQYLSKPTRKEVRTMLEKILLSNIIQVDAETKEGLKYTGTEVFDDIVFKEGAEDKLVLMMKNHGHYPLLEFRHTFMKKRNPEKEITEESRVYHHEFIERYNMFKEIHYPESPLSSEDYIVRYLIECKGGDHRAVLNGKMYWKNLQWDQKIRSDFNKKREIRRNQLKLF